MHTHENALSPHDEHDAAPQHQPADDQHQHDLGSVAEPDETLAVLEQLGDEPRRNIEDVPSDEPANPRSKAAPQSSAPVGTVAPEEAHRFLRMLNPGHKPETVYTFEIESDGRVESVTGVRLDDTAPLVGDPTPKRRDVRILSIPFIAVGLHADDVESAMQAHLPDAVLVGEDPANSFAVFRCGRRDDTSSRAEVTKRLAERTGTAGCAQARGISVPGLCEGEAAISLKENPDRMPVVISRCAVIARAYNLDGMPNPSSVAESVFTSVKPPKIKKVLKALARAMRTAEQTSWLAECPYHKRVLNRDAALFVEYYDDDTVKCKCGFDCPQVLILAELGLDPNEMGHVTNNIEVTPNVRLMTDAAIALLAAKDIPIYWKGRSLVRLAVPNRRPANQSKKIVRPDDRGVSVLLMPDASLLETLSAAVCWVTMKVVRGYRQPTATAVPPAVVAAMSSRGEWPSFKEIRGVVETPVLRADGSILTTPGHDEASALFHEPSCEVPPIPDAPTREDALHALAEIRDIVTDFPFASDDDLSAWIAAFLTPFAREVFDGPVPLSLISGNVRGVGKSLLVDLPSVVHTGRRAARSAYTDDDAEMRKRITAIVMEGDRFVLLDNIAATLGGAVLDAALTSMVWKDRVLGKSKTTGEMPIVAQWYATGNNTVLKGDTGRRALYIQLASTLENPEDRQDFKHADLIGHIKAERGAIIAAGLTILRAYIVAGSPKAKIAPWGSFEGWDFLRHVMIWCGLPDPKNTQAKTRSKYDEEAAALKVFCQELGKVRAMTPGTLGHGMAAKDIIEFASATSEFALRESYGTRAENDFCFASPLNPLALSEAVQALVAMRPGQEKPTTRQLGQMLTKFEGRHLTLDDGQRVRLCIKKHRNLKYYYIESLGTGPAVAQAAVAQAAVAQAAVTADTELVVVDDLQGTEEATDNVVRFE